MIRETRDHRMPVMQVKVQLLAEPAERAYDVERVWQSAGDRVVNVSDHVGQPVIPVVRCPKPSPGWRSQNLAEVCLIPAWPTSMQQLTRSAS